MRHCLCFVIGISFLCGVSFLAAQETERNEPIPLRILRGQELIEAQEARDDADRAWEALKQNAHAVQVQQQDPKDSRAILIAECPPIIEAFQEVVDKYPHTEIACYCAGRISGIYNMTDRHDLALELKLQRAVEYAGTIEGVSCDFGMGLTYLQGRKNPEEALKWLARVPAPSDGGAAVNSEFPVGYRDRAAVLDWSLQMELGGRYFSVQETMIKCELRLGRDDEAEDRLAMLKDMYPGRSDDLDRYVEIEHRSLLSERESLASRNRIPLQEATIEQPEELSPHLQELEQKVWATIAPPWTPEQGQREAEAIAATIEGRVLALNHFRHGENPTRDQALVSLAEEGDITVDAIEKLSEDQRFDFGGQHLAVRVLHSINSEKSRAILLRFGLGELGVENPNLHAWAASRLIECDPAAAWMLLDSETLNVVANALNTLHGTPIDAQQMALLINLLDQKDPDIDYRVATVMAYGCTDELVAEALESMTTSLMGVAELPNIDEEMLMHHGPPITVGEFYYQQYLRAFTELQVDNIHLRKQAQKLEGRAQDVIYIALARKEDSSVHDKIIEIIQNEEARYFRVWAVHTLRTIGSSQDIGFLKELEANDPFVVKMQEHFGPNIVDFYPVRSAAKDAIVVIEADEDTEVEEEVATE